MADDPAVPTMAGDLRWRAVAAWISANRWAILLWIAASVLFLVPGLDYWWPR